MNSSGPHWIRHHILHPPLSDHYHRRSEYYSLKITTCIHFLNFLSSSGTFKMHLIMLDYSCTTLRIGFSYLWSTQVPWILSHYKYIFYYRKKKSERKRTSSSVVYTQRFRIKLLKQILYCVLTWLLCSYPLTEYGYMRYFPPFSTPGAQPGVSGSCSLPQLWPIIRPQRFCLYMYKWFQTWIIQHWIICFQHCYVNLRHLFFPNCFVSIHEQ